MSRGGLTSLIVGFAVAAVVLALAAPAGAQPPTGKKFTVDLMGAHINSPYNLIFIATDCVTFTHDDVVCMPLIFNDCGTYEITGMEGSVTHFKVEIRAKIGAPGFWLFEGPIELFGSVDRFGAGSAISMSGNGPLRSDVFGLPRTRTNISLHGLQGCGVMPTLTPEESWVRDR